MFNNKVYTQAPRVDCKRPSESSQGPIRKIRKVIHFSPEAQQFLRNHDLLDAPLQVSHNGIHVFVAIRPPVQQVPDLIQNVPRNENRPSRPIRPAGR